MKLIITRHNGSENFSQEYAIPSEGQTLLEMLKSIKSTQDATLSFRHACGSGICGSCSVRANGRPVLACAYKPEGDSVTVEPIEGTLVLRDLITDETVFEEKQRQTAARLTPNQTPITATQSDLEQFERQSSCIECASCYSACPVTKVNPDFIGPFLLTKSWRYIADSREGDEKAKIDALQANGVWDCILCGDCVPVCPQGINPKMDITFLQTKSSAHGHMNPNIGGFGGGFGGGFDSFGDFTPSFS